MTPTQIAVLPTPITDAIAHRGYNESAYIAEMTDTARDLERKLAACRAALESFVKKSRKRKGPKH